MKKLLVILLAATAAFSSPQVTLKPAFTVSSKVSATTTATTFKAQMLAGKRLVGSSVTDAAVVGDSAFWSTFASYGQNWARFHHMEWMIANGIITVPQVCDSITLAMNSGVRVSVGLCDKLGELSPRGMDGFKIALMDQAPDAEALYLANIQRLKPVLQHPGVFMVCLSNEVAHLTTPEKGKRFFEKWAPVVRAINPNLLLTDMSDAWDQPNPRAWDAGAKLYDVITAHFYGGGEDFSSNGGGNWIGEGWKWRTMLWQRDMIGKPFLIQEFGSFQNPTLGSNEMFVWVQSTVEKMSACVFAYATGSRTDKFSIESSELRRNLLSFGCYLAKNATNLKVSWWNVPDLHGGNWGKVNPLTGNLFEATGDKVRITQDAAEVSGYIWSWGKTKALWLVKPLVPLRTVDTPVLPPT